MRKLILFLIIIFTFNFVLSATCNGGITNTGIRLQGDWGDTYVNRCNSQTSTTLIEANSNGSQRTDIYSLNNANATLNVGGYVLVIPTVLPSKYKSCELTGFWFTARGNDATGFLTKSTFSSEADYLNSFVTNWVDDQTSGNCISKTLIKRGKHAGMWSYADYGSGHEGKDCLTTNKLNVYKNNTDFAVALHNAGDDGHGFFVNPLFYFQYNYSIEVCDGIDNDCDSNPDNGLGMECVQNTTGCDNYCKFITFGDWDCSGTSPFGSNMVVGPSKYFVSNHEPKNWNYNPLATVDSNCEWRCEAGYSPIGGYCIEDIVGGGSGSDKNNFISFQAQMSNEFIKINLVCSNPSNFELEIFDSKSNKINDFNFLDESKNIIINPICNNNSYYLQADFNNKLQYQLIGRITNPCETCVKEAYIYYQKVAPASIPDNSIFVMILTLFVVMGIITKKRI